MKHHLLVLCCLLAISSGCADINPGQERGMWHNFVSDSDDYMEIWFDGHGKAVCFYSADYGFPRFKEYIVRNDSLIFMEIPENGGGYSLVLPISVELNRLTSNSLEVLVGDSIWTYSKFSSTVPLNFEYSEANKELFRKTVAPRLDSLWKTIKANI